MAIRSDSKATKLRHSVHRREQQIQELNDAEIQVTEAVTRFVRAKVDLDWYTGAKWTHGSIWADLYSGSGSKSGKIHYSLPTRIF